MQHGSCRHELRWRSEWRRHLSLRRVCFVWELCVSVAQKNGQKTGTFYFSASLQRHRIHSIAAKPMRSGGGVGHTGSTIRWSRPHHASSNRRANSRRAFRLFVAVMYATARSRRQSPAFGAARSMASAISFIISLSDIGFQPWPLPAPYLIHPSYGGSAVLRKSSSRCTALLRK